MIFALVVEPIVYKLAILFTLATGVRIGELIAFNENDFNREDHSVKVSKVVSETKGKKQIAVTKTKKTRVEYYPKELEALLDVHLEIERPKKLKII